MTKIFLKVPWYVFLTTIELKKGTRYELEPLLMLNKILVELFSM